MHIPWAFRDDRYNDERAVGKRRIAAGRTICGKTSTDDPKRAFTYLRFGWYGFLHFSAPTTVRLKKIMSIADAQQDMRDAYYGGATGAVTSATAWLAAALVAAFASPSAGILTLIFGGLMMRCGQCVNGCCWPLPAARETDVE